MSVLDVSKIHSDFPILQRNVRGKRLVYLDNAATTQKPRQVIERMSRYYESENANVRRGIYSLSQKATELFEVVRDLIRDFISAKFCEEIIFVSGTTDAINLVARSYLRPRLHAGDIVVISQMEHHSNIVPWQMVCEEAGAHLSIIPISKTGEILENAFDDVIKTQGVKMLALTHVSNVLGTINPVQKMIAKAHLHGVPVLVDGAQAIPHMPVNVQTLDCDFYAFSSHKMYGPTSVGVLYGKKTLLENMMPYKGGGDMISQVTFEKTTYNLVPYKFEAGTPPIADVIGLGEAIRYLMELDLKRIGEYEEALLRLATFKVLNIPGIRIIGDATSKGPILSFVFEDIHAHDVATILDETGVAVRAGHHCAMPLMDFYEVPATVRVSLAFYNTQEDIEALALGLQEVVKVFR